MIKKGVCLNQASLDGMSTPSSCTKPEVDLSLNYANVIAASTAAMSALHMTGLDQYVVASSRLNNTPPIGAPNAACRCRQASLLITVVW